MLNRRGQTFCNRCGIALAPPAAEPTPTAVAATGLLASALAAERRLGGLRAAHFELGLHLLANDLAVPAAAAFEQAAQVDYKSPGAGWVAAGARLGQCPGRLAPTRTEVLP